jgi:hypothetical protein
MSTSSKVTEVKDEVDGGASNTNATTKSEFEGAETLDCHVLMRTYNPLNMEDDNGKTRGYTGTAYCIFLPGYDIEEEKEKGPWKGEDVKLLPAKLEKNVAEALLEVSELQTVKGGE